MFTQEAAASINGDIYLRNDKADLYTFGGIDKLNTFDADIQNELMNVTGVTELHTTYVHEITMNVMDSEGKTHEYPGYVYGIDEYQLNNLKDEMTGDIDEEQFLNGENVIVRNIWREPELSADYVDFQIEGVEASASYNVSSVLPAEFEDYYGVRYNRLPCIYKSSERLKQLVKEPAIYDIAVYVEENEQNQALETVKKIVGGQEHITLQSPIAIRGEAQNIVMMITVIGSGIAAILWFIGILNFVNVISTSILSRRHEIALRYRHSIFAKRW